MGGKGSGGRNRKPTAVKAIQGNPGKRSVSAKEPKPTPGAPEMPAGLSEAARSAWKRVVPILSKMGVLTIADGAALAGYCQMFARWLEAEAAIQQYGIMVPRKSPEGVVLRIEINPAVRVGSDALRHMRTFAAEFGLTPASRARLEVQGMGMGDARDQMDDPWAKFGAPDTPPIN